jgi:hypothetical protein
MQNSNKTSLEEKERKSKEKEKHCQISSDPLPDGKETFISKILLKEKKRNKHHKVAQKA